MAFDSGVRAVREVAEALTGQGKSIVEAYPPGSVLFLGLLSLLPEGWRIAGIDWGISLGVGDPPERASSLDVEELFTWCVQQYPKAQTYSAIVVGSPSGAVAHLAALLRAPLLTSSLLLAFRHPAISPEDVQGAQEYVRPLLRTLTQRQKIPLEAVHHYDPLHDRLLVKHASLIRLKLHALPKSYRAFIREHLEPKGTLVLINSRYRWPQYRLSEQAYVQIGGLGGISSAEYLQRWPLRLPLEVRRESEWGCPEPFAQSVRELAEQEGFELLEIGLDHPWDYSVLAYEAYLACEGARKRWVFFDCFNHQNPRTNIMTGIPGLWLPFNTRDVLEQAGEFLQGKRFERIYITLVPSFSRSPDTAPLERWQKLLTRHSEDVRLIGISPSRYPADPLAPFCLIAATRDLRRRFALTKPLKLKISKLKELAQLLASGQGWSYIRSNGSSH